MKTTESGGLRGYDAGKKIKGRKRHIITDTIGLLVGMAIHPGDAQDRYIAMLVIQPLYDLFQPAPSACRRRLCRPKAS